jgi:UDP-N-acetylmuramoyl-L-alanyl-D-glutamate--2,6-diaminopimelate ligase
MRLDSLVRGLRTPASIPPAAVGIEITTLAVDSRDALPGALFFALPGARTDGARFAAEAVGRGARAVVSRAPIEIPGDTAVVVAPDVQDALSEIAARFHGQPSRALDLVGVTGTNGKTTVTHLVESILRAAGRRPGVIGTIEYRFESERRPAPFTTPRAHELQEILATMRERGATDVVMEVSSHALALGRVRDCEWKGAAFTNLTRDHLDFHADMEDYFAAKARLFTELLPASSKADRFAVVNQDDPYGKRIAAATPVRVVTFGRTGGDVVPIAIERTIDGLRGEIAVAGRRIAVESALVGEAHLDNLLTAAAIAFADGIDDAAIAEGIRRCAAVPGRMERVDGGAPFAVLVDYAHTPDALERALAVLRDVGRGRSIVVFGCGGDRDRGKRPLMGEIAGRLADVVILTSDNPRSEQPGRILAEIESGVREAGRGAIEETDVRSGVGGGFVSIQDRRHAIRLAIDAARPGDVVLIAGKGHEPYQLVGAERRDFDDRVEARRALASLGGAS